MTDFSLNQRIINIKDNADEINRLIEEYKPFIASVVEKHIGRYVEYGRDDELSIALMAFHEAVEKYDISRGNFLSFARITIKHRLVDFYRREQKKVPVVYMESPDNEEDENYWDITFDKSIKEYDERQISELRRWELMEMKKELSRWGITFADVARSSPKQESTRKAYLKAANFVINTPEVLNIMKTKRYLPVDKIVSATKIPRKTVERGRNYIIAAVLILSGDYQYIREYIQWR
ncbi:MAG: polymerase sigma factor [Thermoanaerobacteraceae bacterium]|jgi:RNA polymerase sigma factor|nr:polymerase sigma factor [Thermoanaerobacteraceae bacterium]MDN5312905.1 polymerase sigma factor [Thermoanaerobacteraceae bacterium]